MCKTIENTLGIIGAIICITFVAVLLTAPYWSDSHKDELIHALVMTSEAMR